jgi:hypothetical protein
MGAVSPDGALYISGNYGAGIFSRVLPVKEYSSTPTPNLITGDVDYTESDYKSVNRHGFAYAGRVCPVCGNALQWYKDGANYWAFCAEDDYDEQFDGAY